MRARLTVLDGALTKRIDLQLPTVIGRGSHAKVKLPSSTVSRTHCEIYSYEGQIAVRDLDSSNGTLVNGHRIQGPTFVTADDEVRIGPVRFQLAPLDQAASRTEPRNSAVSQSSDVPDLRGISVETTEPVAAVTPATCDASEVPVVDDQDRDDEGSVLRYVEPTTAGARSFVGIVTDEQAVEPERVAPEVVGDAPQDAVAGDDSSLQDFFNSFDG